MPMRASTASPITDRLQPRVYKELHRPGYFCSQLPGRIVFNYKQLSSTTQCVQRRGDLL